MVENMDAVLNHAETVVIGNNEPDFQRVPEQLQDGQCMVDFVRINDRGSEKSRYDGICW
jgi:GDP-mannose 6-dehydrogenase